MESSANGTSRSVITHTPQRGENITPEVERSAINNTNAGIDYSISVPYTFCRPFRLRCVRTPVDCRTAYGLLLSEITRRKV